MTTKELITNLRLKGHTVAARKRSDGGWLITKIDRTTYSGAKGNQKARELLGESLSQKKLSQYRYNVQEYIRGKKKQRTLEEKIKGALRKVQRVWRKNKVQGRITSLSVKRHVREFGEMEAYEYLKRMTRYGQGYAYEKNVEYLAQYIDDAAESISEDHVKEQAKTCASIVRAYTSNFQDKWIPEIYAAWYKVVEHGGDSMIAMWAINFTSEIMKG